MSLATRLTKLEKTTADAARREHLAKKKKLADADDKAALWADAFVRSAREKKDAVKRYDDAKEGLLEWLAGAPAKALPDGRTVSAATVHFDAATIERRAYDATTVTVAAAPAE